MTFLELRQRVAELAGLDQTQTSTDAKIQEWVNQTYREIASVYDWPWLVARSVLQTEPDITTGTVSVTNNSTSFTFSSAPSLTGNDIQYDIQIDDNEDWYPISSITGTAGVLKNTYLGSTNGTASYILRRVEYSLASDVDRIKFMRNTKDDVLLQELRERDYRSIVPDATDAASPRYYYFNGKDENNNWQIGLYPIPDTKLNLPYSYYKEVTDLSADSDEALLPPKFHNALVFGALALYGYNFIDDTRQREAQRIFVDSLEKMRRHADPGRDSHLVIQPWDQRSRGLVGPRLPGNFGPNFHF